MDRLLGPTFLAWLSSGCLIGLYFWSFHVIYDVEVKRSTFSRRSQVSQVVLVCARYDQFQMKLWQFILQASVAKCFRPYVAEQVCP